MTGKEILSCCFRKCYQKQVFKVTWHERGWKIRSKCDFWRNQTQYETNLKWSHICWINKHWLRISSVMNHLYQSWAHNYQHHQHASTILVRLPQTIHTHLAIGTFHRLLFYCLYIQLVHTHKQYEKAHASHYWLVRFASLNKKLFITAG